MKFWRKKVDKKSVLKKIKTLSAAILLAAPIASSSIVSVVSAADEAQSQTPQNSQTAQTQQPSQTEQSSKTDQTKTPSSSDQTKAPSTTNKEQTTTASNKKVKTFKVAIVKKNYGIYQGNFENKKSSSKYFHKTFNVSKTFTHNGKNTTGSAKKANQQLATLTKMLSQHLTKLKLLRLHMSANTFQLKHLGAVRGLQCQCYLAHKVKRLLQVS